MAVFSANDLQLLPGDSVDKRKQVWGIQSGTSISTPSMLKYDLRVLDAKFPVSPGDPGCDSSDLLSMFFSGRFKATPTYFGLS